MKKYEGQKEIFIIFVSTKRVRSLGLCVVLIGLILKFIDLTYWLSVYRHAKPL